MNWDYLVECGTIAQSDVDSLFFTDDVEEAYQHISRSLHEQASMGILGKGFGGASRRSSMVTKGFGGASRRGSMLTK